MSFVPINFSRWLEQHKERLQPPVNNWRVQEGRDFFIMAVGGPNERSDYHINETEEWFYQLQGDMLLRIVDTNFNPPVFRDVKICEGEMFLLPGGIPHNPVRFANTVGLVIERTRAPNHMDRLRWYCQECRAQVYEETFHCTDIYNQLKEIISRYANTSDLRTCKNCGHKNSPN